MSLFSITLDFLESYFHGLDLRPLGVTKNEIANTIREFYAYSAFASPLMPRLAISGCFQNYKNLSLLFLPFLVHYKEIYLTGGNCKDVMSILAETDLLESETLAKVRKVDCCRWGSIFEVVDYTRVETFLSLLPGLKILTLKSHTTDAILEYLVRHCPNLQVLDCREDSFCEVTDDGFKHLALLQKLRYVLFDSQADEYEEEDEQMQFTADGVAFLMTSLPELIKMECPEYLMRDALHTLKRSSVVLPTIKCIHLEGYEAHADTFIAANEVCPNITTLSVMVHQYEEKETVKALTAFKHLTSLTLNKVFTSISSLYIHKYGKNLTVLDIKKQVFTKEDLFTLDVTCPNLKLLAIFDHEVFNDSFSQVDSLDQSRPPLFASLETLVYKLRDFQGLLLFLHKECFITSFFARVDSPRSKGSIRDVLDQIRPDCGYWPHLKVLSIPELQCSQSLVMKLIEGLPSLERINVRLPETTNEIAFAFSRRNIKLSSYFDDEPFPPKHLAYEFDVS